MSSLGRVAAGIAHEIRNPLSGINVYLNAMDKIYERGEDLEKIKAIIVKIQSASRKIEDVIRRVMDFARPSDPKLVLGNINQPVKDAFDLSSVTMRKRGIEIQKTLTEDLPLCRIDTHLIEQVILNLINNAAEAMQEMQGTKRIEIKTSIQNGENIIEIADSGPGIPFDLAEKIFDPFYSTKNGSSGIGLSLSRRIITDHGGSLDILTSELGGAKFTIKIPIKKG
jgi:signal transduction histidine kinase